MLELVAGSKHWSETYVGQDYIEIEFRDSL